jgi:hypothetical protein
MHERTVRMQLYVKSIKSSFPQKRKYCRYTFNFNSHFHLLEQSFSTMNRITSYLRASMSDNLRLDDLWSSSERKLMAQLLLLLHIPEPTVAAFDGLIKILVYTEQ